MMPEGTSPPRRTPLYDWHVAQGARLVDFAGWEMPIQYTSITEEHQAVRTGAGLFDISHMGRLFFEGGDALDLIQRLYTNNAASMKERQIRYGLVCNAHGGIRDDVLVYHLLANSWLMVVNASNREKILDWINQHRRPGDDVNLTDQTFDWGMVAVQGPRAVEIVANVEDNYSGDTWQRVASLKYYHAFTHPTAPIILSRTGYTGEDGAEVIVPASALEAVCGALQQSASRLGVSFKPCGLGARDTLRLEAAMPLYGHELSEEIDPFQAGLGWAVKMEKGDFIGRAALQGLRQDATRRQRVGLDLDGKRIAREGAAVIHQGREVGRVTSGTFSPTLARVIAMAYVDPALAAPGIALEVDVRGKPAPARVVRLPFYRKKSQ
jgi:aminomethyltransferase